MKNIHTCIAAIFSFLLGSSIPLFLFNIDNCNESVLLKPAYKVISHEKYLSNELQRALKSNYILLIAIITSPNNKVQRDIIRNTWASQIDFKEAKYYFVVGSDELSEKEKLAIKVEQSEENDIVLLPHVKESYSDLTKKVLTTLVWFDKYYDFNFILKCDDDTFIQVPRLLDVLKNNFSGKAANFLYWGFFDGRSHVRHRGKYKETNWILCDRYLPYALGGGYVLARQLVQFISKSADMLSLYNSEDVSVGVWLSALNITRVHDTRFDTEFTSRGCRNDFLVTHKKSPAEMQQLHSNLLKTGLLCQQEHYIRNAYEYNWHVPPSQCCVRNDIKDIKL